MGFKISAIVGWILLLIAARLTNCQDDSLRSAVNAVDRRQRDLSEEIVGDYGYSLEDPEELTIVSDDNSGRDFAKSQALERILLDYLEEDPRYDPLHDIRKRLSSSFRERLEEDKERQLEEFLQNLEEEKQYLKNDDDDDDYDDIIRELWDKYKYDYPSLFNRQKSLNNEMKRNSYYPKFGLDSVGLRKRNNKHSNQNTPNDPFYLFNHNIRDDKLLNNDDEDYNFNLHHNNNNNKGIASYSTMKRFPVSKRSPEITHEHKRSTTKKENNIMKTDPKVVKDLKQIFSPANLESSTAKTDTTTIQTLIKNNSNTKNIEKFNKEQFFLSMNTKPLEIKKKSINWSDYFGLDRRKKTNNDDLENEWIMERYHKAIAMANKRNLENPLQSFKIHDDLQAMKKNDQLLNKKENLTPEEKKFSEMDTKLKTAEDTIIDDALKYTGAHIDGDIDSKENQEIKDKIISRLAAAYSLEKMRRAISEYKLSIAKEKLLKQEKTNNDDYDFLEDKRGSVARKHAINEDHEKIPESDNNIKCTQGDENCEEQNYGIPSDILDETNYAECPKIQRVCVEFTAIIGHYGRVFETACNLHQMCLLCSNNSWFTPTRQCNALFLSKAFQLCNGKQDCQKEAQRSVRYLLNINRNLRMESLGDCQLACPDRR